MINDEKQDEAEQCTDVEKDQASFFNDYRKLNGKPEAIFVKLLPGLFE